jgi:hypothetical protein
MAELILQIPPDIEEQLRKNARSRQVTEENYVIELMRQDMQRKNFAPTAAKRKEIDAKLKAFQRFTDKVRQTAKDIPALQEDAVTLMREERAAHQL